MQVFAVRGMDFATGKKRTVITTGRGREQAKSNARQFLGSDPDRYVVEPITDPGDDAVFFNLTLQACEDA